MNEAENYLELNRQSWNERTKTHLDSKFYDNQTLIEGRNSLNEIELEYLKDVAGKKVLHLQCHFGQDTISLSRMGARAMGVDLSDEAINAAIQLNKKLDGDTRFLRCDILSLPEVLDERFDIVFTSYGTIGWLPDIEKWAEVVNHFLKPGGRLIIADFHPVVWMMDTNFSKIEYRYFNDAAIIEDTNSTYTDGEFESKGREISWNHSLGEIISALINTGLNITAFREYDYSPYDCFSHLDEFEKGKFRVKHLENKIPMVYLIQANKDL